MGGFSLRKATRFFPCCRIQQCCTFLILCKLPTKEWKRWWNHNGQPSFPRPLPANKRAVLTTRRAPSVHAHVIYWTPAAKQWLSMQNLAGSLFLQMLFLEMPRYHRDTLDRGLNSLHTWRLLYFLISRRKSPFSRGRPESFTVTPATEQQINLPTLASILTRKYWIKTRQSIPSLETPQISAGRSAVFCSCLQHSVLFHEWTALKQKHDFPTIELAYQQGTNASKRNLNQPVNLNVTKTQQLA